MAKSNYNHFRSNRREVDRWLQHNGVSAPAFSDDSPWVKFSDIFEHYKKTGKQPVTARYLGQILMAMYFDRIHREDGAWYKLPKTHKIPVKNEMVYIKVWKKV